MMGYIYLYTGTGAGKTTNALGLALRSIGHGHKVVIIQFLKSWKKTGEYKFGKLLPKYYEIYQFGRPGWFKATQNTKKVYKFGKKKFTVKSLQELDRKLCHEGLEFAKKILKKKKPHLLVLDEINLAVYWKLLDADEVLELLRKIPKRTDVVLTGRFAPKKIMYVADFVNEIIDIKHPEEIPSTRGIQY